MKSPITTSVILVLILLAASFDARSQTRELDSMTLELKKNLASLDSLMRSFSTPASQPSGTGQQAKPGDQKDGGVVYWVDETGRHGLIAYPKDLGIKKWSEAMEACKSLGGGWHLASKEELNKLYQARYLEIVSSMFKFHSSTEADEHSVWIQSLSTGEQSTGRKTSPASTVAVRSF